MNRNFESSITVINNAEITEIHHFETSNTVLNIA